MGRPVRDTNGNPLEKIGMNSPGSRQRPENQTDNHIPLLFPRKIFRLWGLIVQNAQLYEIGAIGHHFFIFPIA